MTIIQITNATNLPLPSYATEQSAGMDLLASIQEDITLEPGKRILIKTGISIALPQGFEAQIRPRSGLALKHGITVLNTPGTIDADYRGEIGVILINHGEEAFVITNGMKIAQMVINQYQHVTLNQVDSLEETARGAGGFGSTGTVVNAG